MDTTTREARWYGRVIPRTSLRCRLQLKTLSHESKEKQATLQLGWRVLLFKLCPLFFYLKYQVSLWIDEGKWFVPLTQFLHNNRRIHKNQYLLLTRPISQWKWETWTSTRSNGGHELIAWPHQLKEPSLLCTMKIRGNIIQLNQLFCHLHVSFDIFQF